MKFAFSLKDKNLLKLLCGRIFSEYGIRLPSWFWLLSRQWLRYKVSLRDRNLRIFPLNSGKLVVMRRFR